MSDPVDPSALAREAERYYKKSWVITAGVLVGFVSCGLGTSLLATAEAETPLFTALGVLGLLSGLLMFYVAWWSKRTPLAVIWPDRIELNIAVFRRKQTLIWSELSDYQETKDGNGRLSSPSGPVEIPFTALEKSDAAKLRTSILQFVSSGRSTH